MEFRVRGSYFPILNRNQLTAAVGRTARDARVPNDRNLPSRPIDLSIYLVLPPGSLPSLNEKRDSRRSRILD